MQATSTHTSAHTRHTTTRLTDVLPASSPLVSISHIALQLRVYTRQQANIIRGKPVADI